MTSIVLAILSALLSVAIALSLAAARQALARRRAKRAGFLESLRRHRRRLRARRAADRHRRRLVRAAQAFGFPVCRCSDHGRDRQRRHGHALRHPRHPTRLRCRRRTQRPALRATRHRRLEPRQADRLAGAAQADRHRLRLRHGAVARRSRRDRAVRQRFGPDAALSVAGAAGLLSHRRCGRVGAVARPAVLGTGVPRRPFRKGEGWLEPEATRRHARPPRRCQLQLWRGRHALRRGVQAGGDHGRHGAERLGKVDAAQPGRRL